MPIDIPRRRFLRTSVAGLAATQLPALSDFAPAARAIEPIERAAPQVMKLSLAAYSFNDLFRAGKLELADFIDYCAKLGAAAELTQYYFPKDADKRTILELKRRAHVSGVDISGGAIRNNFTVADDQIGAQIEHVKKWIHHYADLGAPVIRVFGGKPEAGVDEDEAVNRVIAAMKIACETAEDRGVFLGIENHDYLTNVGRLLKIVRAVDSPWFGVNFDSGNLDDSDDPYGDMRQIAPYAVNAQIKVMLRQASGHVEADIPQAIGILRDAKYSGYVVLEYEEEDPYGNIPKYMDQLRDLIDV